MEDGACQRVYLIAAFVAGVGFAPCQAIELGVYSAAVRAGERIAAIALLEQPVKANIVVRVVTAEFEERVNSHML